MTIRKFATFSVGTMLALICSTLSAADPDYSSLNAKALVVKLPSDIKWKGPGNAGIEQVVISGDPTKPGLYVVVARWYAHHNSRPHFHPNDRFIAVLSGTWWVNTGAKYDPDGMKPVPAGSVVTHFANEIHYDGAKDEDAIIEIIGMGPATATPAEEKK